MVYFCYFECGAHQIDVLVNVAADHEIEDSAETELRSNTKK